MNLLILHRKHADHYFAFETEQEFEQIALDIIAEADEIGFFYEPDRAPPEKPEKPDPCPDWALEAYEKAKKSWARKYQRYQAENAEWAMVEKARNGNAQAAVQLLYMRQNAEYEEWEIQPVNRGGWGKSPARYWKYTPAYQDRVYFNLLQRIADGDETAFAAIEDIEKSLTGIVTDPSEVEGEHFPEWDNNYSPSSNFSRGSRVIRNVVLALERHYRSDGMEKVQARLPKIIRPTVRERLEMLGLALEGADT